MLNHSALSTVARCLTDRDAQISLEKCFNYKSCYCIIQSMHQLQTTKRGNSSITTYANQMNTIVDNLDLADKPMDNDDLINLILNSVSPKYESVVNSIQSHENPIALDDVDC